MTRRSIALSILLAACLVLALCMIVPMGRVTGEEPEKKPGPAAGEKPGPAAGKDTSRPPAVKLDIEETVVDEKDKAKPSKYDYCRWLFTKKFKELGFRVIEAGEGRRGEEKGKGKKGKGKGEGGKGAGGGGIKPESPPDAAPDLVITVKIRVKVWYSEYWGQKVAWPGVSSATAKISDPAGKVLVEIKEEDKKGGDGKQDAIVKNLKRISPFVLCSILKTEPVYSRIPESRRSVADAYIAKVEKIKGKKKAKK
jgi:hypothetical protein